MNKIPFFIGNLVACFVPNNRRRERVRGRINLFLFRPYVSRFIKSVYGEKVKSLKLVRQRTLKRVIFVVNDKYYIKVFRSVTKQALFDFIELMDIVRKVIPVEVPVMVVDKKIPMYACVKNTGRGIHSFDKQFVLKHQAKIHKQIHNIIKQLQTIDVDKIPNNERFIKDIQGRCRLGKPDSDCRGVLAHFDMNPSNFLFDDDLNVTAVIDWDNISVTYDVDSDWLMFNKNWDIYASK